MTSRYAVECANDEGFVFASQHLKLCWSADTRSIVQKLDGEIIAAVVYQEFNTYNVFMHVCASRKRWLTRSFIYWAFHYPFEQLKARRITGWVESDNIVSRKFCEKIGFMAEATLKGAGQRGQDVILYVMHREDCRYV